MKLGLVIARSKNRQTAVRLSEIIPFSEANRRFTELRAKPIPEKAARLGCTVLALVDITTGEARTQRFRVSPSAASTDSAVPASAGAAP